MERTDVVNVIQRWDFIKYMILTRGEKTLPTKSIFQKEMAAMLQLAM